MCKFDSWGSNVKLLFSCSVWSSNYIYNIKSVCVSTCQDISREVKNQMVVRGKRKLGQVVGRQLFLSQVVWKLSWERRSRWPSCPFQTILQPTATSRSSLRTEHKPLKADFKQTIWRRKLCVAFLFKCFCLTLWCSAERCVWVVPCVPVWFISARWDKTLPQPVC